MSRRTHTAGRRHQRPVGRILLWAGWLALALAGPVAAKGAKGGYVVVVPGYTPSAPGDACVAEGVATGQETQTADGTSVLALGVYGVDSNRCPDARFPTVARTQKLASEAVRSAPSTQCVPRDAQVGDELMLENFGRVVVLSLGAPVSHCRGGVEASVIGVAAHRAARAAQAAAAAPSAPAALAPAEPSAAEVRQEYDRLYAAAAPTLEYRVRHMLLGTREDAVAALERIRAGRPFAEVAAEVSKDPGSRGMGGDLGWAQPSFFVREFAAAMQALAPAGLSPEPVRTAFGWHVVEVLETQTGKQTFPAFDAVRERIAARLKQQAADMGRVPAKAVCRKMVAPELLPGSVPEGSRGTVTAEVQVAGGRVVQVLSLTGPEVFHAAVTAALNRYECDRLDRPVIATQTFTF